MGRLILGRAPGESVRLLVNGVVIWVSVKFRSANRIGLLFEAPPEVQIDRDEVLPPDQQRRATT